MNELKINHGAAIVSIVLLHVLGFLWYGPIFGDPWMEAVGLTMADAEAGSASGGLWATNTVATIGSVYMIAWLFVKLNVQSPVQGLVIGAATGFFLFLLPTMSGNMFAQSPYNLAWITGGFETVGWAITGGVLGAWTKKS